MRTSRICIFLLLVMILFFVWAATPVAAKDTGRIEGQVTHVDGGPLAAVTVSVNGTSAAAITDREGHFVLKRIPAGTYTLTFSFLKNVATGSDVSVSAGSTARADQTVDWDMSLIETVTVYSASRREETIGEAPGAVTRVQAEEIERRAADGQVPKLLEFTPGVEINQTELYDFNVNSRGFNRTATARTRVLIDGRDVSTHAFNHQDWIAFSYALDDIANMEYLRGPSSAIYGANASNGVINLKTKEPRYDLGGRARLTLGELDTTNVDFRWSGSLGNDWYLRATGGSRNSESFLVSREFSAEYANLCPFPGAVDCLLQEVEPPLDNIRIRYGGLRLDKYLSSGSLLTLEGGTADWEGTTALSSGGRFMILDAARPWGRVGYRSKHWELLGAFDTIDRKGINLNGGVDAVVDTDRFQARVQTNWGFKDETVQLVAGSAYRDIDDPSRTDPATGKRGEIRDGYVFAQVDWTVNEHLKLVAAASYDDSSVHDSQVSPKAAVVYRINPAHSLRLTYSEGIRAGELFAIFDEIELAPPLDLSGLQTSICDPAGVDCDLSAPVPVVFVSNNNLEHEENVTYEIGYTGFIANKTIIKLDVYRTKFDKFFSPFLPQLGTPLGRLNDDFGPWEAPPGVPDAVRDAVRAAAPPCLSNKYDGSALCPIFTLTNLGEVETWGADLGLDHFLTKEWRLFFSYSWWGWDPKDEIAGLDSDELFDPATPRHKVSAGVGYSHDRFDAGLQARWVDDFMMNNGFYIGPVESYTIADLNVNYALNNDLQIGVNISNVFDNEHYQMFGGSLIGRRALAYVLYEF